MSCKFYEIEGGEHEEFGLYFDGGERPEKVLENMRKVDFERVNVV